jgi:hypothetical protein
MLARDSVYVQKKGPASLQLPLNFRNSADMSRAWLGEEEFPRQGGCLGVLARLVAERSHSATEDFGHLHMD